MDEDQSVAEETGVLGDMSGLRTKLNDLETRKKELAACQAKVEEDIQAIKRTIQLVAA
jgi:outer membrane murein-binding lipoprotein Lpp